MTTAVSLHHLTKRYGTAAAPVLDGVDLAVEAGELVALLGPSGCGKTTTLKIIAGLLRPTEGDVRFEGRSVLHIPAERRAAAMVFQKALLFPHMSVAENVGFGLRMRRRDARVVRSRVREMLELVRLEEMGPRMVVELSGGQEQRVALARALIVEPEVLLLDEPLSQLDATLRVEMRELIRSIQRQVGVTTVFVTHDQEEAVVLADRIALMRDGRVLQYATPLSFYERPASLDVARFFGGQNLFPGIVKKGRFSGAFGVVMLGHPAPDGPGILAVRQEVVEVVVDDGDGPTMPAVVEETSYLGTHVGVRARLPGANDVTVHFVVGPTSRLTPGDPVALRLPPEHCHVMAAEAPQAP